MGASSEDAFIQVSLCNEHINQQKSASLQVTILPAPGSDCFFLNPAWNSGRRGIQTKQAIARAGIKSLIFLVKWAEHTRLSACCVLVGDIVEIEGKWRDDSLGLAKWLLLFMNIVCLVFRMYRHFGVTVYIFKNPINVFHF